MLIKAAALLVACVKATPTCDVISMENMELIATMSKTKLSFPLCKQDLSSCPSFCVCLYVSLVWCILRPFIYNFVVSVHIFGIFHSEIR